MSGASPLLTTVIHSNKLITFCFFSKTAIYNIFFIRWTDIIIDFFCSRTSFKRFQLILKLFYSFWIVKFCIAKDSVSASLSPVNSIYDTHLTFFNLPKNLFAASFWVKFVSSPTTCSSNDQDIPRKITFWDHLFIHALAVDLSQNFNSFYVTFKIYSWSISSYLAPLCFLLIDLFLNFSKYPLQFAAIEQIFTLLISSISYSPTCFLTCSSHILNWCQNLSKRSSLFRMF